MPELFSTYVYSNAYETGQICIGVYNECSADIPEHVVTAMALLDAAADDKGCAYIENVGDRRHMLQGGRAVIYDLFALE